MTVDADAETQRPTRTPPSMRSWLLFGGVIVVFLVGVLAASVSGRPSFEPGASDPTPPPLPDASATPTLAPGLPTSSDGFSDQILVIIGIVLALIVLGLLLILVIWVLRLAVAAWRNRPLRRSPGAQTDVDVSGVDIRVDDEPDAPAVRRGIAAARAAVEERTDPTDAIIAAWLGLEETAADSGIGRALSETQVEFTLRMLLRRPGIDEPARDLLRLYEGVRYGGRIAGEQERSAAARALERIEAGWR